MRNFARRNLWKVSGVYTDRGEGTEAHPEFDRVLENLRAGKAKGILVPRISMCVASLKEAVTLMDSLNRDAIRLVALEDDFDSEKASSTETIRALAKLERELFSKSVKNGLASARAEGEGIKPMRSLGKDPATVSRWESSNSEPDQTTWRKLTAVLGLDHSPSIPNVR